MSRHSQIAWGHITSDCGIHERAEFVELTGWPAWADGRPGWGFSFEQAAHILALRQIHRCAWMGAHRVRHRPHRCGWVSDIESVPRRDRLDKLAPLSTEPNPSRFSSVGSTGCLSGIRVPPRHRPGGRRGQGGPRTEDVATRTRSHLRTQRSRNQS